MKDIVVTDIWLSHVGYLLKNVAQLKFDNTYIAVASFIFLLHSIINIGGISLNANLYRDV